jgi:hypothetical protein
MLDQVQEDGCVEGPMGFHEIGCRFGRDGKPPRPARVAGMLRDHHAATENRFLASSRKKPSAQPISISRTWHRGGRAHPAYA